MERSEQGGAEKDMQQKPVDRLMRSATLEGLNKAYKDHILKFLRDSTDVLLNKGFVEGMDTINEKDVGRYALKLSMQVNALRGIEGAISSGKVDLRRLEGQLQFLSGCINAVIRGNSELTGKIVDYQQLANGLNFTQIKCLLMASDPNFKIAESEKIVYLHYVGEYIEWAIERLNAPQSLARVDRTNIPRLLVGMNNLRSKLQGHMADALPIDEVYSLTLYTYLDKMAGIRRGNTLMLNYFHPEDTNAIDRLIALGCQTPLQ
ncbi:MAG TPA: hypothetical protein VMV00_00305 [Candidatus Baltobacteraceae bacterium]|nr:hypothetical protein [Candidatus Baltobacteraceae bacterium]